MSTKSTHIETMRMDLKDMLNYRGIIERKRDKAIETNNTTVLARLNKQLDIMDMMFEMVWVATMTDSIPQFNVLTGGDFDVESLKLALPQYATKSINVDTQVQITYEEETQPANIPVTNEEEFMSEIKKLLSKSAAKNIPTAIEIYNQRTGKNLMPADAYAEIKNALPEVNVIKTLDRAISTQLRTCGPVMVYKMIKGWTPTYSDTEIGRIVEDAVRRTIKSSECVEAEKAQLEAILTSLLPREEIQAIKAKRENVNFMKAIYGATMSEEAAMQRIGYVSCALNPHKRAMLESNSGRRGYVEKGY